MDKGTIDIKKTSKVNLDIISKRDELFIDFTDPFYFSEYELKQLAQKMMI